MSPLLWVSMGGGQNAATFCYSLGPSVGTWVLSITHGFGKSRDENLLRSGVVDQWSSKEIKKLYEDIFE